MEEQEQEKQTPRTRGGAREGAGRKLKYGAPTLVCNVRIRKDYAELIDSHFDSRSEFIQKAVKEKLRREGLI